jgi:hypothetical protein
MGRQSSTKRPWRPKHKVLWRHENVVGYREYLIWRHPVDGRWRVVSMAECFYSTKTIRDALEMVDAIS